ncbi:carbohydrate kinase [Paraflavisolibacter sp. H34]|uniref:carbohydrate kinase family protein n=1 Tax=Huijunlia imazamoxiresistens TaxID=3127457 RepID=UPI003018DD8C
MTCDAVCYGEILWDVLPGKALPGGAPMNVAYHLKKLGAHPALISRAGNDAWGEKLIHVLSDSGLPTDYVQTDDRHPTGLVNASVGDHNEVTYEIVQPVAWDFIDWQPSFPALLAGAEYFIFGSLTSRSAASRHTLFRLLENARTKVLDINLRPPHFQRSGVEALLEKADILKMNESELQLLSGWYHSHLTPEAGMRLLQDRFHLQTIIVTMGGEGAQVLDGGTLHRHPGYPVQVSDTIGSGDAFLAGFLYHRSRGASVAQSLAFACGLGALVATYPGACPDYPLSALTQLMNVPSP